LHPVSCFHRANRDPDMVRIDLSRAADPAGKPSMMAERWVCLLAMRVSVRKTLSR
jgi:hypothetical protein